jgi:hypothetical protein
VMLVAREFVVHIVVVFVVDAIFLWLLEML